MSDDGVKLSAAEIAAAAAEEQERRERERAEKDRLMVTLGLYYDPVEDRPHGLKPVELMRWHQSRFLYKYALTGKITIAAAYAGVVRSRHNQWKRDDPEYLEKFEAAHEAWIERLEMEAERRALQGVKKPVGFYKGVHGGTYVTEYSDRLLEKLLEGNAPEKYGQKVEAKGLLANLDFGKLPADAIERLAAGEHPLNVLGPILERMQQKVLGAGEPEEVEAEVLDADEEPV